MLQICRERWRFLTVCCLGIVIFAAWQFLPSMKSSLFEETQKWSMISLHDGGPATASAATKSRFERQGIECPSTLVPDDGLGVRKRLPQALIIGTMKSGTGALIHFLGANSAVSIARDEFDHFSSDARYHRGLEAYRALMPPSRPGQLTLEKSVGYWSTTRLSAPRIYAMNPCVKLIVSVIDPVERLISHFAHNQAHNVSHLYRNGQRVPTFHDYFFYIGGAIRESAFGVGVGHYAKLLKGWLEYFPPQRILVVDGVVLKERPWVVMKRIEMFLELPTVIHESQFYRRSDGSVFCLEAVGCLGKQKGREHPNVSSSDRQLLRDFYRASNDEFFHMIGTRMQWGY